MGKHMRIREYIKFMESTSEGFINHVDELEDLGFFTQPASIKYHGAYEGGLFDHSLATAKALVDLTEKLGLKWERPESPYIIGMFHDICKCDNYVKVNDLISFEDKFGNKIEIPTEDYCYANNPNIIIPGHGDKSVIILSQYMRLTDEEIACIRWHMGAYEKDPKMWEYYGRAIEKYPNVLYTHTADMIASKILGV